MSDKKSLGVFGLGDFGQLMVTHLMPHFSICAYDPAEEAQTYAATHNIPMCSMEEVASSDIVVLAVPVPLMETVLEQIKDHVKAGALILDVGSVKVKPSELMKKLLPETVDIICTHPLFGPVGAANGTKGLTMALCPLRGPTVDARMEKLKVFLETNFGLELIIATPEEHDKEMAYIQGLPHMIAKILIEMEPLPRRMVTPNYKHFLRSIDVVRRDSDDLFKAICQENPYTKEIRDIFFEKANALRKCIDG